MVLVGKSMPQNTLDAVNIMVYDLVHDHFQHEHHLTGFWEGREIEEAIVANTINVPDPMSIGPWFKTTSVTAWRRTIASQDIKH